MTRDELVADFGPTHGRRDLGALALKGLAAGVRSTPELSPEPVPAADHTEAYRRRCVVQWHEASAGYESVLSSWPDEALDRYRFPRSGRVELRTVYESLGLEGVRSYIQSGNVVFRTEEDSASALARTIEPAIADAFGFDVPVVLRSAHEMEAVVRDNPFLAEGADPSRLHVMFLSAPASPEARADYARYRVGPDELRLVSREAYLHCPGGLGDTKLTPTFMDHAFGSACTTRNWRTVNAVLEMARTPDSSQTRAQTRTQARTPAP